MSDSPEMTRGSVWQVRLDPVEGSEQGGTRPVVIISNDVLNRALPVVTVAVMTTQDRARLPHRGAHDLPDGLARTRRCPLPGAHHCQVTAHWVRRHLAPQTMLEVDAALRVALSL